jgi:hypothetical protein
MHFHLNSTQSNFEFSAAESNCQAYNTGSDKLFVAQEKVVRRRKYFAYSRLMIKELH